MPNAKIPMTNEFPSSNVQGSLLRNLGWSSLSGIVQGGSAATFQALITNFGHWILVIFWSLRLGHWEGRAAHSGDCLGVVFKRHHRWSLWLILLITLVHVEQASVGAQVFFSKVSEELITLEIDSAVTKKLATLEDFIAERKWDIVANVLRQTSAETPDKLVAIAPGWFVSAARYCQLRAAALPPEGLSVYRKHIDPTAKQWLTDAERTQDRAGFLKIVRQAFASSAGENGLTALAESSFEQSDFATARAYWEMLLPAADPLRNAAGIGLLRSPAAVSDASQVRANLILCSLFSGDRERAKRERIAFRHWHAGVTGRLAGQDGKLDELLLEQFALNGKADIQTVRLFAKEDNSTSLSEPFVEQVRWSVTLPTPTVGKLNDCDLPDDFGDVIPLLANGKGFVTNGESVFAFDLATGHPAWGEGAGDVPVDIRSAAIHSLAEPLASKWPISNRPRHSLTLVGDRLYARLGSPITGKAKQEPNAHSELVGLDVGVGEGKLVWRVTTTEVDPQDPLANSTAWCFEGVPVADARRVYVALRRSLPQEQINVACFDADTARLLWNRKVGISAISTDETVNSTTHLRLTLAQDSVFVSTNEGAIAALNAHDGLIRWLRTYPVESPFSSRSRRRTGDTSGLFHEGVLYVAPLDSRMLLAIHAESGLLLWQREWPDPIQDLLGITNSTLIVSGRSLWGVRLDTGEPAWPQRRVGFDDPEGSSFGRGVLVRNEIWWPTKEELFVVAADSGRILRRIGLRELTGRSLGSLAAWGPFQVVSHHNKLLVLGPTK